MHDWANTPSPPMPSFRLHEPKRVGAVAVSDGTFPDFSSVHLSPYLIQILTDLVHPKGIHNWADTSSPPMPSFRLRGAKRVGAVAVSDGTFSGFSGVHLSHRISSISQQIWFIQRGCTTGRTLPRRRCSLSGYATRNESALSLSQMGLFRVFQGCTSLTVSHPYLNRSGSSKGDARLDEHSLAADVLFPATRRETSRRCRCLRWDFSGFFSYGLALV
ncbi:hypothetical protein DFH09DRAFT_538066 [Mycena vulgaris]|nr:hypothetical protein DFH09DRAFT_538066 [Mycena vulgaris]